MQEDEPEFGWYMPASQLVHMLSDVAPMVELDFPASHATQVSECGVEL